ncbi:MAG: dodecin domain-containing protein [Acidobacteriota bacterium]
MFAHHEKHHQDVIRVIVSSEVSFDDAIKSNIAEVQAHHEDLDFKTFEVVQMQGTIKHEDGKAAVKLFQVVLDIAGTHEHGHHGHDHD